jgi:hypothetical protein
VVDDGAAYVSGVRHQLGGEAPGIRDWSMRNLEATELDGSAFGMPAADFKPTPDHPNGVVSLDHLVISTPDMGRTIESFESAGIELRRTRPTGTAEAPTQQAFFKVGEVILEVVGSRVSAKPGSLRFFGLAWTVGDHDEKATVRGDRLRPAKDAVQPGRRIATLDRAAGSTVSMAFMTPDPPR